MGDLLSVFAVAPHAGARVEMIDNPCTSQVFGVAPHAGARVEISQRMTLLAAGYVAPHAGARVEISETENWYHWCQRSLPTRERGLKYR